MRLRHLLAIPLCLAMGLTPAREAHADKVRELAEIAGARENQLVGYGVVTGLRGTGDDASSPLAAQSMLSMLRRLGVQTGSQQVRLKNVAAVMVTATIPAFAKPGTKLDVVVSSIGNAKSLEGGVLMQTLLKGADRKTYAVAQGSMALGGYHVAGKSGSSRSSGSTTVGTIPGGALIERAIPTKFLFNGRLKLSLRSPSFTVAARMAAVVQKRFGLGTAHATDGGTVVVLVPDRYKKRPVELVAALQALEVKPERRAKVVVNERTQTIVAGGDVRLAPVAVVHGGLTIVVKERPAISQPVALSNGRTMTQADSRVRVKERKSTMRYMGGAATLADLSSALGTLGLSAREMISVLQALRSAGALEAELVVQ